MFPSAWKHVQKSLDSSRNMSLDLSGSSGFFIRHKRWQCIQHRWGGTSSKGLGCPATLNVGIWVSASLKNGCVCGSAHALGFFEWTKSGAQKLRRAGNIVVMLGIVPGGWPSRLGLSQAPTSQAPETSTTLPFSPVGESMPSCQGPWHSSALQCMSSQVVRCAWLYESVMWSKLASPKGLQECVPVCIRHW